MCFIFDEISPPSLNKRFKIRLKSFFESIPEQKTVSKVLKTWYFPYSVFWSACQWGEGYRPHGYATGHKKAKYIIYLAINCKSIRWLRLVFFRQSIQYHAYSDFCYSRCYGAYILYVMCYSSEEKEFECEFSENKCFLHLRKTFGVSLEKLPRTTNGRCTTGWEPMQARSRKFAMGGLFWGSEGEAPSCRMLGVWGGAPGAQEFCIFLQK